NLLYTLSLHDALPISRLVRKLPLSFSMQTKQMGRNPSGFPVQIYWFHQPYVLHKTRTYLERNNSLDQKRIPYLPPELLGILLNMGFREPYWQIIPQEKFPDQIGCFYLALFYPKQN